MSSRPLRLCLFGAAPGTRNLGVDALAAATIAALAERAPDVRLTVFDYRRGARSGALRTRRGDVVYELLGANHSRRLWRGDTLATMRALGRLGRIGSLGSAGLRAIRAADAVLDLSGGDSFSDLYGRERFDTVTLPKRIALEQGVPLVLLPQTYGPFDDARVREEARRIVLGAESAWARDARSYEVLEDLLGADLDARRHRLGVDMAFGLEAEPRAGGLSGTLERWHAERGGPIVGLNVSGLVWSSPERAARYGFRADYPDLMERLLRGLLEGSDARVALVPHVLEPPGHYESDVEACAALAARRPAPERVTVVAPPFEAGEIKHEIARMDWFCGTRMHATIAALSSGVPAGAVAYSPKFKGVFELCGQASGVADPTALDAGEAAGLLLESFRDRAAARARLAGALVDVRATLAEQLDAVLETVHESVGPA